MWYPLGQAFLYVGIAALVLAVFAVCLASVLGRFTGRAQQQYKEIMSAFKQGREEEK